MVSWNPISGLTIKENDGNGEPPSHHPEHVAVGHDE